MSLAELITFYFVFLQNTNCQFKVIKNMILWTRLPIYYETQAVKTIFPIKGSNSFCNKTMQPETTQMSLVELIKFYFVFLKNTN